MLVGDSHHISPCNRRIFSCAGRQFIPVCSSALRTLNGISLERSAAVNCLCHALCGSHPGDRRFHTGWRTVPGRNFVTLSAHIRKAYRWHRSLAHRYLRVFPANTRPSRRDVLDFLKNDGSLRRNRAERRDQFIVVEWINEPFRMSPVPAAAGWDVPGIESSQHWQRGCALM